MEWFFALTFLCVMTLIVLGIPWAVEEQNKVQNKVAQMSPEELSKYRKEQAERQKMTTYGTIKPQMICPHCQTKGSVRTKPVTKKTGISGGKATAALLTGGMSMLATGLSRKEGMTQAHCEKCNNTWTF